MYVTDTPVIDRLAADHLHRAVSDALSLLGQAGHDLDIEVWGMEKAETAPRCLSDARDAVLTASERVREALALLGIEEL